MRKHHRILWLLLALTLAVLPLAGCASTADRCVKVNGAEISFPALGVGYQFPAPWFVVTEEELDRLAEDPALLSEYVDEEGNLLKPYAEAYTSEQIFLVNGKTQEVCRITVTEDLDDYSLEAYALTFFDQIQADMFQISLPFTWSLGGYDGYAVSTVAEEGDPHITYYFLHEKGTFVEIATTGYSDHAQIEDLIEGYEPPAAE